MSGEVVLITAALTGIGRATAATLDTNALGTLLSMKHEMLVDGGKTAGGAPPLPKKPSNRIPS